MRCYYGHKLEMVFKGRKKKKEKQQLSCCCPQLAFCMAGTDSGDGAIHSFNSEHDCLLWMQSQGRRGIDRNGLISSSEQANFMMDCDTVDLVRFSHLAAQGLNCKEPSCCQSRWGLATADYHSFTRLPSALEKKNIYIFKVIQCNPSLHCDIRLSRHTIPVTPVSSPDSAVQDSGFKDGCGFIVSESTRQQKIRGCFFRLTSC